MELLRDVGMDVDRIFCTEREPGIHQCTFIFECDDESEAIYKKGELLTSICESSERRFAYTEVGIGNPDVVVSKMRLFECEGDILLQEKEDGKYFSEIDVINLSVINNPIDNKWMVLMIGIEKPWRPNKKMEDVG